MPLDVLEVNEVMRGALVTTTRAALSAKFWPTGIVVVASALLVISATVPTTYEETVSGVKRKSEPENGEDRV